MVYLLIRFQAFSRALGGLLQQAHNPSRLRLRNRILMALLSPAGVKPPLIKTDIVVLVVTRTVEGPLPSTAVLDRALPIVGGATVVLLGLDVTTAVTLLVMAGGPATIETVVRLDAEDTAQTRTMVILAPTSGWTMIPHCPLAVSEFSAVRSS